MVNSNKSIYQDLSDERKQLQSVGKLPQWYSTSAWQLLKEKYTTDKYPDLYSIYKRISNAASKHMDDEEHWDKVFFNLLWSGHLACSTPVLANMGTTRGCPVSCSGNYVGDSVYEFYESQKETAILTKNGFGTSSYLGAVRGRGDSISSGGNASGVLPVLRGYIQLSRDVSQGNTRRGAWAGYIEIDHPDFWEVVAYILNNPDDCNVGWLVSDKFIQELENGDEESINRYQRALKTKMVTGKGYFVFIDRVNRANPESYKKHGLTVKASNLCTEITLPSDEFHTFTCVLSSMNLAKYDEWKDTDAVQNAIVFLDCVAEEFIQMGRGIKGLEKAVRFTESGRALGLGTLGFHSYLQQNMIDIESTEAHMLNNTMFKGIQKEAKKGSQWLAKVKGEPKWCKGEGVRNTHLLAIAPNSSSALICGGVSQGIEPVYKNVFVQGTPAGEINRINPVLVDLMKVKGVFNHDNIDAIIKDNGSVQLVDWLTDEEKVVFKTAFEINQEVLLRLASVRQRHICQAQSLNLFFPAEVSEEEVSRIHKIAFKDKYIKSLYYVRSEAGVRGSTGECVACEG
jgi:ribonucleoside-diphosphate reductase alpha chain